MRSRRALLLPLRRPSVRRYLFALSGALLVPVLLLAILLVWQFARNERGHVEERARAAAQRAIIAVDLELQQLQALAVTLASSAALRVGNYERFQQRASEVLNTLSRSETYGVVVRDLTGRQVVNTRQPWGTALPLATPSAPADRIVVATKRPRVSDLFVGATVNRAIVSVSVPVLSGEEASHVLSVAVEPHHFVEILNTRPLSPGWAATLLDGNNRVIARSERHLQRVGTEVVHPPADEEVGPHLGLFGERVISAGARSQVSGWLVSVSVPAILAQAPVRRSMWIVGGLTALLIAICLILAFGFGDRIAGAMQALAERASQLAKNDPPETRAIGIAEADHVAEAITAAGRELSARESALRASFAETVAREREAAELRASKEVAERANAAKSEFLSTMSHELRTPLTGLLGMADLLATEPLNSDHRGYVEAIRTSGGHLLAVIDNVLDFSRIEAGQLELQRVDFSVQEVLENVRSLMAPQALERGLMLSFEVAPSVPDVLKGDPTRIKQSLLNLVGNALKFTQQGSVAVQVARAPQQFGGEVCLRVAVRDTGLGIEESSQSRLFNPFVQADGSIARRYGGSGLGLAITKRLIEAMHGKIGVQSAPGQGSCFWFDLPLEIGTVVSKAQTLLEPLKVAPRRVLLAEDVELNRKLITRMLERYGHQVTCARNGIEAVALAAKQRFDLVLMDVHMPEMDGLEAARRIRQLAAPAGTVPIVALTANVVASEQERFLAAGMDECLAKPVDWSKMFSAIERRKVPPRDDPPGESDVELVNPSTLRHLRAALSGEELERSLMAAISDAEQVLAILSGLSDAGELARAAHRLKGTAGLFGLARIARLGDRVSEAVRNGQNIGPLLAQLRETIVASRGAVGDLLSNTTGGQRSHAAEADAGA